MKLQVKSNVSRIATTPDLERRLTEAARRLRRVQTPAEGALWRALRGAQTGGAKFRRQQPIGPFVVDFFQAEHRLVVEVDGSVHAAQIEADRERQCLLEAAGYRVMRFTNEDVRRSLPQVLDRITQAMQAPIEPPWLRSSDEEAISVERRSPSPLEGEGAGG